MYAQGSILFFPVGHFNYLNNCRYFSIQRLKGDVRILGDTDFLQAMLSEAKDHFERYYELKRLGHDLNNVATKVAAIYNIDPDEVMRKGRQKPRVDAKGLFCYWAVRELKMSLTDLARQLDLTVSGVGYAVPRGESIALRYNYRLLE
jgi:putative transposase